MITSKSNELIKKIKSLHQKKYRDEYRSFLVEGIKLVKEAVEAQLPIEKIVVCSDLLGEFDFSMMLKYSIEYVTENVFEYISSTDSPQGIMAVVEKPSLQEKLDSIVFALDTIQDPGNLGTIIRTLDCAGIHSLLLSQGTVDVYNPKVVRSTMGAIFRVSIQEDVALLERLEELRQNGYQIVVTDLEATKSHYELDFQEKMVIVIGNESNGVSTLIKQLADKKVKIPMLGGTESLNAGVAASLIAYENVRQKVVDN